MMQTEPEIEARLRRDAAAIRQDVRSDSEFHYRIMARVAVTTVPPLSPTRASRLSSQLIFAAGVLVVALALGFAFSRLNALRPAYQNGGAPALAGMMMAVDTGRRQLVVFGGGSPDLSNATSNTWIWDGSSWTLRHPTSSPPGRSVFSMTYDATRGTIVIFGGMTAAVGPAPPRNLSDTWVWNGTTWREAHSAVVPPPINGAAMAYDPTLGLTVLLDGGFTWTWDGTAWTKGVPAPPGKGVGPMAYDPASDSLVLLALSLDSTQKPTIATWHFDGKTWTMQAGGDIAASWSPRLLAEDPLSGSVMGVDGLGRTWSWDGNRWTVLNVKKVSFGAGAAIAFDATRQLVLLFGGQGEDGRAVSDLSAWDGKQWTSLQGGQELPKLPSVPANQAPAISLGVRSAGGDWLVRRPSRPNGRANGLYQSIDGGRTWQRRLEFDGVYDGMSWTASGQAGVIWSIDMAPHGCAGANSACTPPTQSLMVYGTADGGRNWSARAPTSWAALFVYFRGVDGWATTGGPGNGAGALNLYHTSDGGASWAVVGPAPAGNIGHTFGVGETPLVFATNQTGWFATRRAGQAGNSGLLITTNGGRSWAPQPLQPPLGVAQSELMLGSPEILADGHLLLPAFVGRQTDPNNFTISRWYIYSTVDGGSTWADPQPVQAPNGARPTGDQFQDSFLDALHWWFTATDQRSASEPVPQASPAVGRTTDGGKTWQIFNSPTIIELRFSDAALGWALSVAGADNTNLLLRTTDGGAHWQHVAIP